MYGVLARSYLYGITRTRTGIRGGDKERRRQCEEFGCGYGGQSCMLRVHTRACVWPESETAVGSIEGHGVGETVSSHRGRVVSDRTCLGPL
jgi:hypothetical protein